MQKTKLFKLLESLSDKELSALESYLPQHSQEGSLWSLFRELRGYVKELEPEILTKETLYQRLFPGVAYDATHLDHLMNRLNKLSERFLGQQQLEREPILLELAQLRVFSERGLEKQFAAGQRRLIHRFANDALPSEDLFYGQFRYESLQDEHHLRQQKRVYDPSIERAAQQLDRYYFLERLHLSCSMLDRQHIIGADYTHGLTEEWLAHLRMEWVQREPLLDLYYTIYQMLTRPVEEGFFRQLKSKLVLYENRLTVTDQRRLYFFPINYCARRIRAGEEAYLIEALRLYEQGVERGLLMEGGQLSPWTYTNIVKLYLRLKRFDAADTFITTYAVNLPTEFRHNAQHFNLAELCYYTNEKERAQQHLMEVAYTDLTYYLGARVLLAKIYYETEAEEALLSHLAAFMIFLQRNKKISRDLRQTYLNFCKLLLKLLRGGHQKAKQLRETVASTSPLTDRQWLLRCCDQFISTGAPPSTI